MRAVTRQAGRRQPASEPEDELCGFLHLAEPRIVRRPRDARHDLGRLLARKEARPVDAIDAQVGKRSAAGQAALEPPLAGIADVLRVARHELANRAQRLVPDHAREGQVERLVLTAVGGHQQAPRLPAGVDHPLAVGHGRGQRLLAQDVFAGLGRPDRVLRVHRVGQHDVHHLDLGVVGDAVEAGVVVDRLVADAELAGHAPRLFAVTAHERDRAAVPTVTEGGEELTHREAAETDEREADAFGRWIARLRRALRAFSRVLGRRQLDPPVGAGGRQRHGGAGHGAQALEEAAARKFRRLGGRHLWGASTSSYQVEGEITNNDWHFFTTSEKIKKRISNLTKPNLFYKGTNQVFLQPAGEACRVWDPFYYKEDFDIAKKLGMNAIKISIEWSRVEPQREEWNENAIDHYKRMIKYIVDKGHDTYYNIKSYNPSIMDTNTTNRIQKENVSILFTITLFRYSFLEPPSSDSYWKSFRGWENDKTIVEFAKYVSRIVQEFKNLVDYWITISEPISIVGGGYISGIWSPGFFLDGKRSKKVLHNLIEAHIQAYNIIKEFDDIDADNDGISMYCWMFTYDD